MYNCENCFNALCSRCFDAEGLAGKGCEECELGFVDGDGGVARRSFLCGECETRDPVLDPWRQWEEVGRCEVCGRAKLYWEGSGEGWGRRAGDCFSEYVSEEDEGDEEDWEEEEEEEEDDNSVQPSLAAAGGAAATVNVATVNPFAGMELLSLELEEW